MKKNTNINKNTNKNTVQAHQKIESLQKIHRIISLAPHLTELVYAMKKESELVGTVEQSNFPVEAQKIPVIGNVYGLNLQKIHQLKPTIALVWQGTPKKHIALLQQLKIPLFIDESTRLYEFNETWQRLGRVLNVEKNVIPQLKLPKVTIKHKKTHTVWYELWSEPLMTLGTKHWIHDIFKQCGLQTVATNNIFGTIRKSLFSLKQEAIQPEMIITHQKNRIDFWKKNGYQVYWIDENSLTIPSPRLQIGINDVNRLCGSLD